jgi:hypothetical protein
MVLANATMGMREREGKSMVPTQDKRTNAVNAMRYCTSKKEEDDLD